MSQEIAVPNVWGTINMEARGRGQALVQLDITYGVDYEHHRDIAPKYVMSTHIKYNFISGTVSTSR